MKVFATLLIGFSFLILGSCESDWPKKDDDITDCIKEKAERGDDDFNDYKFVYKYVKKDGQGVTEKLVYFRFVNANDSETNDELVDKGCNLICEPQRGVYSGLTGDCATPLFNDPQEWTLIWTNPKLK
ncbi:MAG: hypothetical protein R2799_10875 [Crocinitomicaceae bacterium]